MSYDFAVFFGAGCVDPMAALGRAWSGLVKPSHLATSADSLSLAVEDLAWICNVDREDDVDAPELVAATLGPGVQAFAVTFEGASEDDEAGIDGLVEHLFRHLDVPHAWWHLQSGMALVPGHDGPVGVDDEDEDDDQVHVVTKLEWYTGMSGSAAAASWVELAESAFHSLRPARFGEFTPRAKFGPRSRERFIGMGGSGLTFTCTEAQDRMRVGFFRNRLMTVVTVELLSADEGDRALLDALVGFLPIYAVATDAVLAAGFIDHSVSIDERGRWWYGMPDDKPRLLYSHGEWRGLPPEPYWIAWFGRDYAPLLEGRLALGEVTVNDGALVHTLSATPAPAPQLVERARREIGQDHWLPADLRARPRPGGDMTYHPDHDTARVIPERLRSMRLFAEEYQDAPSAPDGLRDLP